ncbi:hypothetical protein ACLF99_06255 [Helicobacter pylori]
MSGTLCADAGLGIDAFCNANAKLLPIVLFSKTCAFGTTCN